MVTTTNPIVISVDITCHVVHTLPRLDCYLDTQQIWSKDFSPGFHTLIINTDLLPGKHFLHLDFRNKQYRECTHDQDMAVEITAVRFQHLKDDFKLHTVYAPDYPEPWASQQKQKGIELDTTIHSNYLGWNGRWSLEFNTPIYQWLHRKLNMGWLLEPKV